jgi:hypothetical protein
MGDPVAWLLIEPGWKVLGRDGAEIGRVSEVDGDLQKDIFSGLTIKTGLLGASRYVPAERVGRIDSDGFVELDVTADELQDLEE